MKIRLADGHDEPEALRLHKLAWDEYNKGSEMPSWDTPGDPKQTLLPFLETGQLVVADNGDRLAGMVAVATFGKWWMLMNIVVDDEFRGNGVAKKMVEMADSIGVGLGATEGYIWAPNRLGKFYSDAGYKPVGQIMVKNA